MQELIQIDVAPQSADRQRHTADDNRAPTEALRDELAEGLLYLHSRANANTSKTLEVASFSYALIELLTERGILSFAELDERKRIVGQRLVEKYTEKGMGVALTQDAQDKYRCESSVQIDCDQRLPLCRAACCRLRFALSFQDVEEGCVKWDLGHPYMIRQGPDGYCHHLDRTTQSCGIYDQRPFVCRSYDCRKDKRIWLDFDQRRVNPDLDNLFQQRTPETRNGNPTTHDAATAGSVSA
jgi:Fe-S-cluster containining protein